MLEDDSIVSVGLGWVRGQRYDLPCSWHMRSHRCRLAYDDKALLSQVLAGQVLADEHSLDFCSFLEDSE